MTARMSKGRIMTLTDRDKTREPSGWGWHFHHTDPQRRVPCVLGDMLCPRSADDIPPITPEAMASVQSALNLLANLVADIDHGLFLGEGPAKLEENRVKARDILLAAKGLLGILRVVPQEEPMRDFTKPCSTIGKVYAPPPEVLRGFHAMACALTAPQAECPDVRAACEWISNTCGHDEDVSVPDIVLGDVVQHTGSLRRGRVVEIGKTHRDRTIEYRMKVDGDDSSFEVWWNSASVRKMEP